MRRNNPATMAFATIACVALAQACSTPMMTEDSGPDLVESDAVVDATPMDVRADAPSCPSGQSTCAGQCTNTQIDPANCGACETACPSTQSCRAGRCTTVCSEGQTICGTSCTSLQNDRENCGMCGTACAAGQVCSMGMCAASCGTGLTDCAGRCRDVTSDPAACGGCGMACPSGANSSATCAMSSCGLRCATGFGNCNGMAADGCETALNTADNCGGCGVACRFNNAAGTCGAMGCAMGTCNAGFADCDTSAANGCEVDTRADRANCGACGNACGAGQVCSMGTCVATCRMGLTDCTGSCRDTANDPTNCGACGTVCAANANQAAVCAGSRCAAVCSPGFLDCDRNGSNGCEVDGRSSLTNCGACGTVCATANATPACSSGACAVGTCNAGFANCDMSAANGCEIDTRTDRANCGACGNACAGIESCVAGVCVPFATVAPTAIPNSNGCTTGPANNGTRLAIDSANAMTTVVSCASNNELRLSRSTDGGVTWSMATVIASPMGTGTFGGVAIAAQATTLYLAYIRGGALFFGVSTNAGGSWTFTNLMVSGAPDTLSVQAYNNEVYVGQDVGPAVRVFRNSARGVGAFTNANAAFAGSVAYGDVLVNPANGDVWAAIDTPSIFLARSTDGGNSFSAPTMVPGSCFYSDFAINGGTLWAVGSSNSTLTRVAMPAGTAGTVITGLNYPGTSQATTIAAGADGSAYVASQQPSTPFITLDRIASTETAFNMTTMRRAIDTDNSAMQPSVIQLPNNRGAAIVYTRTGQIFATVQTY